MLSKEAKHRLHHARISSNFRRSFPSSSLMYCALPTFLPCNFHPLLRCPYQSLTSPANVNASSSQVYTFRYLSSAACMTSLKFLYAIHQAQKEEPPAKVPCTAVRASSLPTQAFSLSACVALSSNKPGRRDYWIWPDITSSTNHRSLSVKRATFSPTVPRSSVLLS